MDKQTPNNLTGKANRRKLFFAAFILMDIALAAVLVSLFLERNDRQFEQELRQLGATIYPESVELSPFTLNDQFSQTFDQTKLLDKWTLVFFGFTSCPDICPLTMSELAKFSQSLQDTSYAADTEIIMVTVDPDRDSDEAMAEYLLSFDENFIGLNGEAQQLAQLATELYVNFSDSYQENHQEQENHQKQENHQENQQTDQAQAGHGGHDSDHANFSPATARDFMINHSAHIAVINPEGRYHGVLRAPHRDQELFTAYTMIRKHW